MLWSPKSSIKCIRNCWKYEEAVGHIFISGVSFSPVELNISICWYGWNLKKTCVNLVTHWKPFIGTKITIINYLKKSWIVRMLLKMNWEKLLIDMSMRKKSAKISRASKWLKILAKRSFITFKRINCNTTLQVYSVFFKNIFAIVVVNIILTK